MTIYVDLVLDTGELVRIECPNRFEDEMRDTLEYAMKVKDWWAPGQFKNCHAEFLGRRLERVAMSRVVGVL